MVNHAMPKMAEDFPGIVSKMWSSDVENPFFGGGVTTPSVSMIYKNGR